MNAKYIMKEKFGSLYCMVQIIRAVFWKHMSPYPVLKFTVTEENTGLVRYELAACHRILMKVFLTTSIISTGWL